MQKEIYKRYLESQTIKTKNGATITVKKPVGVFVAIKKNNGQIVTGQSILHKKDKWNMKMGLNQARKNATSISNTSVHITEDRALAYLEFVERARRYFLNPNPRKNGSRTTGTRKTVKRKSALKVGDIVVEKDDNRGGKRVPYVIDTIEGETCTLGDLNSDYHFPGIRLECLEHYL